MIIVNKYIGLKKKIVWSSVYIIYASTYWLLKKLLKDSSLNETTACVSAKMLGIKKRIYYILSKFWDEDLMHAFLGGKVLVNNNFSLCFP